MAMTRDERMVSEGGILPVADLLGRHVWDEAGNRLGTLRDVKTDDDGRIVALDVQRRWMLGPHEAVDASGMRLEGGDVVVQAVSPVTHSGHSSHHVANTTRDTVASGSEPTDAVLPTFIAGPDGARQRFGGLSPISNILGALVAIATCLLLGGVLFRAFDVGVTQFDTSDTSAQIFRSTAFWVGMLVLAVGFLLGGIASGRAARFDGARNGFAVPVWAAIISALFSLAAVIWGSGYNVVAHSDLPDFHFAPVDDMALWGTVSVVAAFAVMLLAGVVGGKIGELWHRRADREMFNVVPMGGRRPVASRIDSVTPRSPVTDTTHSVDQARSVDEVHSTPTMEAESVDTTDVRTSSTLLGSPLMPPSRRSRRDDFERD
ncbi:MAG: conserved rane protein of unknown function [Thermoleophilia bacterium]|nr:conserved rane protein of unknown function [Thermoleophilia bacterium]